MADGGRPGTQPDPAALPGSLRRAMVHLRRAGTNAVTLAELAQAAGVAERTLHRQFRAFLGETPLAWLRRQRLGAVQARLLAAEPGLEVGQAAAEAGFAHAGRFALAYRRQFGESPSATLARGRARAAPALPAIQRPLASLAIVPLRAAAGRLAECLLAEGLTEHLAATLAGQPGLALRLLRAALDRPGPDPREAGARYALLGRVEATAARRVRVTLRLLDLESGTHLWGEAWDGAPDDPFDLQDRIAEVVRRRLRPVLLQAEIGRARAATPRDLDARGLVLRALPLAAMGDPTSAGEALEPLEQAMDRDPGDAVATALAAWCHVQRPLYWQARDDAGDRARARALADCAGALDGSEEAVVLAARGSVAMALGAREEADILLTRAVAVDPGLDWAWERLAWFRCNCAEVPAAQAAFRRALRLKGSRASRANCFAGFGAIAFARGRFDAAAWWYRRVLAGNPRAVWWDRLLAPACLAIGDRNGALEALRRLRRAYPGVGASAFAITSPVFPEGRPRTCEPAFDGLRALGLPS